MSTTISDHVDYLLRRMQDDYSPKEETRQMTYRAPARLVSKLDAIALFLGVSRNAFMTEALDLAADEAIARIENNPLCSNLTVNDLTIREFLAAEERGERPVDAFAFAHNETELRAVK